MHGIAARLKLDALKPARQHAARPLAGRDRLEAVFALRVEHDEAGQVLRLGPEPIEQPRTHAGPALDDRAGVHERVRGVVVDLLGLHRADHAEVVRDTPDVREKFAHLRAGLTVLFERGERPARLEHGVLQLRELLAFGERFGKRLTVEFLEFRFPVEGLKLRRAAGHAEEDHALCFHRQMGFAERAAPTLGQLRRRAGSRARAGGRKLLVHQRHREAAEAVGALREKGAAVDAQGVAVGIEGIHRSGRRNFESGFRSRAGSLTRPFR